MRSAVSVLGVFSYVGNLLCFNKASNLGIKAYSSPVFSGVVRGPMTAAFVF